MTLWLRDTSSDSAVWVGVNNPPVSDEWVASNNFGMTVSAASVAPVFDVLGYDNLASYNVGDVINITPQLVTAGNPAPTYSVTAGTLPAGATLNASSGVISGTLSQAEIPLLTIQALNSEGASTTQVTFNVLAVGDYGFILEDCRQPDTSALPDGPISYKVYDVSNNSFVSEGSAASVSGSIEITDAGITQAGVNYELTITVDGQTWSLNIPSIASVEIV